MGLLDDLFAQATGDVTEKVSSENKFELNKDSTDIEILDWVMTNLCSRLDVSQVAFKGGYVLNKILPKGTARATMDIDFSIGIYNYYEYVKSAMDYIGNELMINGIIDSYEIKESIAETMSGGIKLHRNNMKDLGIDVGLHDLNYGLNEVNILNFSVNTFQVERMLSDKISAIYSPKRFRRSKDLYDFYVVTQYFNISLPVLYQYITIRGTIDWEKSPFNEIVLVEYKKAYDKLIIGNLDSDGGSIVKPEFNRIIERLQAFMINISCNYIWDCKIGGFVNGN